MIKLYFLSAWLGSGFFYLPFPSLEACMAAMSILDHSIMHNADCSDVDIFMPGNVAAPETSPVPRARPLVHRTKEWSLL